MLQSARKSGNGAGVMVLFAPRVFVPLHQGRATSLESSDFKSEKSDFLLNCACLAFNSNARPTNISSVCALAIWHTFYYLINSVYQGYHTICYFLFFISEVFKLLRESRTCVTRGSDAVLSQKKHRKHDLQSYLS